MARVLVVEDEYNILFLITTLLRQLGHDVAATGSGRDALAALEKDSNFDIVVTDILLPEIDGIELLEILKRRHPKLPVVVISAFQDRLLEAVQKGADNHLKKPFTHQQLVNVVRNTLPAAQ